MTDPQKIEELERIIAEYASLYGLTHRARAYFAGEGGEARRRRTCRPD